MIRSMFMAALATLMAGCSTLTGPNDDARLVGEIVSAGRGLWNGNVDGPFQIHVKENPDEECGIIFTVDDESWVADARGSDTMSAGIGALDSGATVEVWYGLVLDSCPGQSHADGVRRIR